MMTDAEREDKERIKREKMRKLESPLPFVLVFRNWIFGKKRPDLYTRLVFYTNLFIWFIFTIWSGFSYFALVSRDWVRQQKGIDVGKMIEARGSELGFEPGNFLVRLEFSNFVALICWMLFFLGLVLLYRKKKIFAYFTLVPLATYVIINVFYLGFSYFIEDITLFDKILLLISALSLIAISFMIRGESQGEAANFFGLAQDEDGGEMT